MKKIIAIILFVCLFVSVTNAQKVISGKSSSTRLVLKPEFKRGLPPNLFVNMSFEDENNNGIIEADESAILALSITNKGKGPAQDLLIKVKDETYDPEFLIEDGKKIPYIYPEQTAIVNIPIKAGFNIKSAEHKLEISVSEYYGYDMDPAFLILNTLKFQEPNLVFSGLEVIDIGEGTGAIVEDGQLQAGEQVKVKLVVQNIGQNVAKNTKYHVRSNDINIYIMDGSGNLGDMGIGEVKEFWVSISPNKRFNKKGKMPVYLNLTNDYNRGNLKNKQLPIVLNQKPPEPEIVEVKADIESLQKQVARFEYTSNRITTNVGNIIDIRQVPPSKTHRANSIAVIIGIEKYKYFVPAPYASNDALILKDYFKNVLGVNQVYIYTNDDVTGFFFENIFNPDFGELQKALIKNKTDLFVFYSGHGMPSKDGKKVYLFPYDGRIEALETQGYDLNKFYKNLDQLEARSITVFIDACFSGVSRASENYDVKNLVTMKGISIEPKVIHPWENNPDFTVFSSSSFDETSLGFDASETGLFTYFLCAGLQGKADNNNDKKITSGELKDYIIRKVKETSPKIHGLQTPMFYGNENIILGEY